MTNSAKVPHASHVLRILFGALDGGRGRFIMVGNLISKNSVLANFCAIDEVHVSQVNIWDKNGNVSWAAKWTAEEVKAIERFQGYRSFQKEYMNNPITEGAVFRNDWIKWGRFTALAHQGVRPPVQRGRNGTLAL